MNISEKIYRTRIWGEKLKRKADFKRCMNIIYRYLKNNNNFMDFDSIYLFKSSFMISETRLYSFIESIFSYADSNGYIYENNRITSPNRVTFFTYDNYLFEVFEMYGQGTYNSIRLIDDKDNEFIKTNEIDVFNFNDIRV